MWLNPDERECLGATPHQFAIYRIVLGVVVVLALAAAPAADVPSEAWLGLPRAARGGIRLAVGLAGVALALGVFRRVAGPVAGALAILLASYGHTTWAVGAALVLHGGLVAIPASEPWALIGSREPEPVPAYWTTAAWVALALIGAVLGLLAGDGGLGWALAGPSIGLGALGLHFGPKLGVILPAFGLVALSAWLGGGISAVVVALMPSSLACITHDWLPPRRTRDTKPIVFFDGVCAVCDRGMQLLIAEDERGVLRLAPLQGQTSKELLQLRAGVPESMIVYDDGERLERSSATVRIAEYLGGIWRLAALFGKLPLGVRDTLYDWFAHNRYDWFGKLDACRIPTPQQRQRFLD